MSKNNELTVLELQGNLVLTRCDTSLSAIKSAIKPRTGAILLDLNKVSFVDSAGLAILVRLHKLTQGMGTRLALCSLSSQMNQLLQLTSMDSFFEIFTNREGFYDSWLSQFPAEATVPRLDAIPVVTIVTD
jgi:anti-sigma B factor antagonist